MWAGRSEELSGLCCFGEATSMVDSLSFLSLRRGLFVSC